MDNLNFLSKYNSLDDFQLKSFDITNNFHNIPINQLICAPTGSGKSLIAEYAIYHTVKIRNKKVIFTSPIKALSNQKFNDFNSKFAEYNISIGILTGDNKFAPQADCIIVTTEILLNELHRYKSNQIIDNSLNVNIDDIGTIIFDEVHYINDLERGGKWEESLMNIPNNINIIMLSATLSEPQIFGNWVASIQNKPTEVIITNKRVVPLSFNIYYNITMKKLSKEKQIEWKTLFNDSNIDSLIPIFDTNNRKFNELLYQKIIKFHEFYSKLINYNYGYLKIINNMLYDFNNDKINSLFPILFFVLSKKKCLEIALSINIIFNDIQEQHQVTKFINDKIKLMNCYYLEDIEQFKIIKELAIKGIGIHHSGLLPIIKEIIELLYEIKLIKVLFATETFSVGLNMPTKTVVFCDMYKINRLLYPHEFIQMAGRAGRRNIDTIGYVILLPQLYRNNINSFQLNNLFNGTGQTIKSKLNIDEALILRLLDILKQSSTNNLIEYIKNSMLARDNNCQINNQNNIINKLSTNYKNLNDDDLEKINKYNNYSFIKLSKKQSIEYKNLINDKDLLNKIKLKNDYDNEINILNNLNNNLKISVDKVLDYLILHNMIYYNDNNIILTNRGIIGSYIIDVNPIIITDIITDIDFNKLEPIDIITIFATIVFDENITDKIDFNTFKNYKLDIKWIDILQTIFIKYQETKSYELLDKFNFDYIYLLDEFIKTSVYNSKITDKNYLYEGNFIRFINRLLNLLNEIKYIFEITKNIELINIIDKSILLIRDNEWLKTDSIYLKMSNIII